MSFKLHFSILLVAITLLSSCSNYGYISENDVYMQAPTEINLEENENDLTSFNAFKAREKGAFRDEYIDPRVNERVRMNQFIIVNSYMPFGTSYNMYGNQPIRFHGMGMYNSFYGGYGFMEPTFGYGFSSGFGMYGNGFYSPYYPNYYPNYFSNYYGGYYSPYGYGYNPYYYGGGHYNGIANNANSSTVNQPVHYGKRTTLTSSSNRSSSYNKNYTKQAAPVPTTSYNVNDQTLGTSRREVNRRYAGSGDYSNNGKPNNSNYKPNQNGGTQPVGVTHQRAANQSYAPNSSARRSGAVQTQRSINVNSSRGSGSVNSSPSQRTSSPSLVRPQSRGTFSTGSSPRSNTSPSTTRSSGSTNSSSGRR